MLLVVLSHVRYYSRTYDTAGESCLSVRGCDTLHHVTAEVNRFHRFTFSFLVIDGAWCLVLSVGIFFDDNRSMPVVHVT